MIAIESVIEREMLVKVTLIATLGVTKVSRDEERCQQLRLVTDLFLLLDCRLS